MSVTTPVVPHNADGVVVRDSDDPPLSVDTERGRYYRLVPGGPPVYPSITNVKGIKYSEPLSRWKVKMSGNRALAWVVWLAKLSRADPSRALGILGEFLDRPYTGDKWVRKVKKAADEHSLARAERGSKVHLAVEQILTGREVTVDAEPLPVEAFKAFARDFDLHVVEVEVTVVNHTYGYAGTGDLLAKIGGNSGPLAIIDWKSRNSIFEDTALQLAAIRHAEAILRADGTQEPWTPPEVAIGVALGDDGRYHAHQMDISETMFRQFVAARTLFDFNMNGQAKGPAITSPTQVVRPAPTAVAAA